MARKKVKLAYIENKTKRKTTFNKRKDGLISKVNQLSTLCGVDACAVIFNPFDENAPPGQYPKSNEGVSRVVNRFHGMSSKDKSMKMVNHHEFLRQRISKTSLQLSRLRRDNTEKETTRLMFDGLSSPDPSAVLAPLSLGRLNDLGNLLDRYIRDVDIALVNMGADPLN